MGKTIAMVVAVVVLAANWLSMVVSLSGLLRASVVTLVIGGYLFKMFRHSNDE